MLQFFILKTKGTLPPPKGILKRVFNSFTKRAYREMGGHWHRFFRPKHFHLGRRKRVPIPETKQKNGRDTRKGRVRSCILATRCGVSRRGESRQRRSRFGSGCRHRISTGGSGSGMSLRGSPEESGKSCRASSIGACRSLSIDTASEPLKGCSNGSPTTRRSLRRRDRHNETRRRPSNEHQHRDGRSRRRGGWIRLLGSLVGILAEAETLLLDV